MNVVIVESPAKAKSINKYLGTNYKVLASYGHVRDLPSKNGSVSPDEDFKMVWEINTGSDKHLKQISEALKGADALYLATDPDREGEAIAWHIYEYLKEKKLLKNIKVYRSVFNEITKKAVVDAIQNPRELNQELIHAYLARRALDYLVGFNLSPVLWRKLPGSKSAGRVQSVALRLISDREAEIEKFTPEEYWSVQVQFKEQQGKEFLARLIELKGKKLTKFSLATEASATEAVEEIKKREFVVDKISHKQIQRNPYSPFITSTLQQEAARKLGYSATKTMQLAQHLYEGTEINGETVGLITYMRTDSVHLSQEALDRFRNYIGKTWGDKYLPLTARFYKNKTKNAQEAHEAIRPTDIFRTPEDIQKVLDRDHYRLYELIWKRALASQMTNALLDQVSVDIASPDRQAVLRATGSTISFDGFLKLYQESKDVGEEDPDAEHFLPTLKEKESLLKNKIIPEQHFTQPPPRFSEASLVKKLEELGIGRPSTYASIINVLQNRNYVRLDKKQFVPEDRGRLVSTFLQTYFKQYVEYDFTAHLEDALDHISHGQENWKEVLQSFWEGFNPTVKKTETLKISEVLDVLNEELADVIFPHQEGKISKKCPSCPEGKLHLKLGKYGAFIGCEKYPECKYTHKLGGDSPEESSQVSESASQEYPKTLGIDPSTKESISLRAGPYGFYIQLGETVPKGPKPKRSSLPKTMSPPSVTLEDALELLNLPREIGLHPTTKLPITANFGKFGPYIKHGNLFVSVKEDDILKIALERAVELITTAEHTPKTSEKKTSFTKAKKKFNKKA